MTTHNHIVILITFSKYNLDVRKYKIFILFYKDLILFTNFHVLLLLKNNSQNDQAHLLTISSDYEKTNEVEHRKVLKC